MLGDRGHHRREARDRAGAQIVAVRESAGHHDRVDTVSSSRRRATASRPSPRVARPRTRRRARSSFPGTARRRCVDSRDRHLVRLDDRDWRAVARTSLRPARAPASASAASTTSVIVLPMCTCDTFVYPSAGSARSTVAPAGSAIPGRCVTSTCARNVGHASMLAKPYVQPSAVLQRREIGSHAFEVRRRASALADSSGSSTDRLSRPLRVRACRRRAATRDLR